MVYARPLYVQVPGTQTPALRPVFTCMGMAPSLASSRYEVQVQLLATRAQPPGPTEPGPPVPRLPAPALTDVFTCIVMAPERESAQADSLSRAPRPPAPQDRVRASLARATRIHDFVPGVSIRPLSAHGTRGALSPASPAQKPSPEISVKLVAGTGGCWTPMLTADSLPLLPARRQDRTVRLRCNP